MDNLRYIYITIGNRVLLQGQIQVVRDRLSDDPRFFN